ncbi:MAG TPA: hypothetical protein VJC10_00750 [Patescibacteria group bacterium]|nr:hypothetical protein [Patescibacteria group bacterium]
MIFSIVTTLAAAIFFYLLPTLLGNLIVRRLKYALPYQFITSFVVGSLLIFLVALILQYVVVSLTGLAFHTLFFYSIVALSLITFGIQLFRLPKLHAGKEHILPWITSFVLASVAFAIWHVRSPFSLNWDIYEHQTLVNTILAGRFSFVTSQISDTFIFNGYSSIFHLLLGADQIVFPVSKVLFWHAISFIHLLLVVLASFYLTKEVTSKKIVAYLTLIISALVFESSMAFTSLFFLPQTLAAVVFAFLLAQLFAYKRAGFPEKKIIIPGLIFLILTHYVIGTLAAVLYLTLYIQLRSSHKLFSLKRLFPILLGIAGLGSAILIGIAPHLPLGFLNQGEGQAYTQTLREKFMMMRSMYGYFLLFLPLGVIQILRNKNREEQSVLLVMGGLLVVIAAQLPYVLKFLVLERFLLNIVLASGIALILASIRTPLLRVLGIAALLITLVITLTLNASYWKTFLNYQQLQTHIAPAELEAASFLNTHYSAKDVLLVSDPATQAILEAFSGINSPGGTYVREDTRHALSEIKTATSAAEMITLLYRINDTVVPTQGTRLFVLSGRYFFWQQSRDDEKISLHFNIWSPTDLTPENLSVLQVFAEDQNHFNKVYSNKMVWIFEAKR